VNSPSSQKVIIHHGGKSSRGKCLGDTTQGRERISMSW